MKNINKIYKRNNIKSIATKLLFSLLLISVIFSFTISSFAFYEGERIVAKEGEKFPTLMKFGDMYILCSMATVTKNGKDYLAYCIEASKEGVEVLGNYNLTINKEITDNRIYSVLKHGYPNKTPKELGVNNVGEAFLATKQAIYTLIYDRNVNQYSGVDTAAGKRTYEAYKKIVANAKNDPHKNFVLDLVTVKLSEWEITEDNKFIEKEFKTETNNFGSMEIRLKNNSIGAQMVFNDKVVEEKSLKDIGDSKYKVRIPIENLNDIGKLQIETRVDYIDVIAYEAKPDVSTAQKLAVIGVDKDRFLIHGLDVHYSKNETKLEILKIDEETEEPLSYVTFNIYDEENELLYENIRTDKEGKILIEDILPGKYFIKEISTKEGYIVLDEVIEVDLKFNEINKIIISNIEKPEEPEEPEIIDEPEIPEEPKKPEPPKITKEVVVKEKVIMKKLPQTGF